MSRTRPRCEVPACCPFILPVLDAADADAMLDGMDGLVLTGGEDVDPARYGGRPHPALGDVHAGRDAFELALVRAAVRAGFPRSPSAAACRSLNVALGGTLVQDIPTELAGRARARRRTGRGPTRVHDVRRRARLAPRARAAAPSEIRVNSMHHQAVARVATGLAATAHAPDGVSRASSGPTTTGGWSACSGTPRS